VSDLTVDGLVFEVARSSRRKTTAIAIERDGRLVLQAPDELDDETLAAAARSRLPWVHRKLAERLLRAAVPAKDFVGGESFRYLGRTYRLAFARGIEGVALKDGRLQVPADRRRNAELLLRDWYMLRGRRWLPARLAPWAERMAFEPTELRVLDLGYRWASLSDDGSLNMHWQAMALPPSVIDYLFVHELAHAEHPHHDRAFWRAVLKTMPDAEQRREWLRRHGGGW